MGIDYIDLLLIHRPDPFMVAAETGAALDALVTAGKVRAVGVLNFTFADWSLLQSAMQTKLAVNQVEISALHPEPFLDGSLPWMQQFGVRAMAWSPLGAGVCSKMKAPSCARFLNVSVPTTLSMPALLP